MSAAPQHGRRRAVPAPKLSRREALRLEASHSNSPVGGPAKRMAAVAVAAALLAGGGLAQAAHSKVTDTASGSSFSAALDSVAVSVKTPVAPSSISVPTTANIEFSSIDIGASAAATTAPKVKAAADAVTPIASPTAAATATAAPVAVDDPEAAKAYAATQVSARGWGAGEMSCLTQLWERESNWRTTALNPDGGAYGIVQSLPAEKMASVGADYLTNYETQIKWGLGYIASTYTTPCGAWAHSNSVGWY